MVLLGRLWGKRVSILPFEGRRKKGKRPGAGVHRGAGRFWVTLPPPGPQWGHWHREAGVAGKAGCLGQGRQLTSLSLHLSWELCVCAGVPGGPGKVRSKEGC